MLRPYVSGMVLGRSEAATTTACTSKLEGDYWIRGKLIVHIIINFSRCVLTQCAICLSGRFALA